MPDPSLIAENIQAVRARMQAACERVGRAPDAVQLMLVTKTVAVERIRAALACGEFLLGENKVQEALPKAEALHESPAIWHFIGHLQTNKVKDVLRFARLVQSVDRLDLAQKLNQRLAAENRKLEILIQVNTSYEESKFGVAPDQALELIQRVAELPHLQIRGLMTIGLFSEQEAPVRDCFKRLRNLQAEAQILNLPGTDWETLSMGMSGDFEWAIEEGATLVRVGSRIFGAR
ncbi:YggS family pyridoxal phosphate-dependent enzyme [bacterium (Candidatus Blackallbacteria) CG17_big_fil_post_rev_8_21_14_2_50_48_46]|uniref:Pyridoxal phosphate homeostasis protein n=1 Tax=bacterium (Candidatus Blackallbacteria) CG17_big_fil_post_rev_8_21_14_2_50_48_46 TaxID=2014261 RepID=A0A2M7G2I5_9BACT|nr:MAG: YggS family pyridoxal phosphate-dependent enzyme [bacterium (Candidatus Blackallbacteria) CG18_big_fil_WC_8_21_14_2_50_49_26]PIW15853.1 MAG: YggS family pyridoxal phosphate-dependent enzyme [bacterium (Candidatus Blackallbacteria) CG17_big_fil_post_rev_8_21_14_2_50_48_46]PIW49422.1 MAG: YggS family pyridoxal phosphate-dependent enzyme [bacterium (Candidatus Blackallbacteria) CG13_big_fil_rev_8_21_14_2_50_49_14]